MKPSRSSRIGVIAVVPDRWYEWWSSRHQVLTRLSKRFDVVWMNPAHEWRQTPERLRGAPEYDHPLAELPNFTVYTPGASLPKIYNPAWLGALNVRRGLRRARQYLTRRGCSLVVLSMWWPIPERLDQVQHTAAVYHIDDEYSFEETEQATSDEEQKMLKRANQVFVHSKALLEKKGEYTQHIELTPNGVDFESFSRTWGEPADMRDIPRPRIGYVGYIKRQIDWELVDQLAVRHPEWSFVLVGRRSPHPDIVDVLARLQSRKNVYFLGEKPTQVLTHYPQHFDVCILPYRNTAYAQYINPLKLNEYLAAGKPSVGPRIPAVEGVVDVKTATTVKEWSAAIAESLTPEAQSAERRAARQAEAAKRNWESIVNRIGDVIEARVSEVQVAEARSMRDGGGRDGES